MPIFTSCIKSYDSSAIRALRRLMFLLCVCLFTGAQQTPVPEQDEMSKPFPGTQKQLADLLKLYHAKNLKELEKMAKLVEEVQADTKKDTQYVISLQSLKNLEQIEKLSRGIRDRMKRY